MEGVDGDVERNSAVMEVEMSEGQVPGEEAGAMAGSESGPDSGDSPPEDAVTRNQDGGSSLGDKKKHRRGKHKGGQRHRQWKPYSKMTWDERKKVDDRETKRACQKRQEKFADGHPMAPYNTTQFLMDQHRQLEDSELKPTEDGVAAPRSRSNTSTSGPTEGGRSRADGRSVSVDSSQDHYDSNDEEEIFMEKEFTEAYENCHAERLQNMSKDELVREYLELEAKLERAEKRLKEVSGSPVSVSGDAQKNGDDGSSTTQRLPSEDSIDIRGAACVEEKMHKLQEENQSLRRENVKLKLTAPIKGMS